MKLYELTGAMRDFELKTDENGEIINMDELEKLDMAWNEKAENLCLYIKNLRAELDGVKGEKKAFEYRAKVLQNKIDNSLEYLKSNLRGEKFKTPRVSVSYRRSEEVVCEDPYRLDERFKRVKVEADRKAIKDALKAGEDVTGAHLKENVSVILK